MQGFGIFDLKALKCPITDKITAIEHVGGTTILVGDNKGYVHPCIYDADNKFIVKPREDLNKICVCKNKEIKQILYLDRLQNLIAIVIANDSVFLCDFKVGTSLNFSKESSKLNDRNFHLICYNKYEKDGENGILIIEKNKYGCVFRINYKSVNSEKGDLSNILKFQKDIC